MKLIDTLFCLIILQFATAKNLAKNLPEKVTSYMETNYPNATEVEWISNRHTNEDSIIYQAHFYNEDKLVTLDITADGIVLAKETEIKISEIPKDLLFYIQDHKLKFAAVIEYNNEKPVYILETFYKKHADFELFSAEGKVLHIKKHFLFLY